MSALVSVSRPADGVARLRLDRPDRRNALSIEVRDEMTAALEELRDDDGVRVVLVDSTGPVFCAGFDLREFEDPDRQQELWASSDRWHEALRTFPLPLVAAVQGPALAGGFDLATMCDLRVAARSASFARPESRWGVAIYSIVADLVGGALARELTLTDRTLGAEEAHAVGLVTRVVEDDQLESATLALAEEVAARPREGLVHTKAMAIARARHAQDGVLGW